MPLVNPLDTAFEVEITWKLHPCYRNVTEKAFSLLTLVNVF